MTAERLKEVQGVLVRHGVAGARVEVAGHTEEIVALAIPDAMWKRMLGSDGRAISEQIRALGFRYVAVDLAEP